MRVLDPKHSDVARANRAQQVRQEAARIGRERSTPPLDQQNNGETVLLGPPVGSFTKSLRHNEYGVVEDAVFDAFIKQLNQKQRGQYAPFPGTYATMRRADFEVTLGPKGGFFQPVAGEPKLPRTLESPLAGHTYDLEGPDADAVAMPPAPALGSDELAAEMAELYAMAMLRDVSFEEIEGGKKSRQCPGDGAGFTGQDALDALAALPWFGGKASGAGPKGTLTAREVRRRKARTGQDDAAGLNLKLLFRGSTQGSRVGPYISQFLLIGNQQRGVPQPGAAAPAGSSQPGAQQRAFNVTAQSFREEPGRDPGFSGGRIQYGQQVIDQQIIPHLKCEDWMSEWALWLDVQNGLDSRDRARFGVDTPGDKKARFLHTPRDIATYVHYDALYQAYLNACLWLLGQQADTDAGLPEGVGHPTRGPFATFGGPHILTLVTEVATRALKAVRRQKFQIHLRARPEAVGGVLTVAANVPAGIPDPLGNARAASNRLSLAVEGAGKIVKVLQGRTGNELKNNLPSGKDFDWLRNKPKARNLLLPMAFPEGSPVHGSYGAGHATVAGACVTILKAFFEMYDLRPYDIPAKGKMDKVVGVNAFYRHPSGRALNFDTIIKEAPRLFKTELPMKNFGAPRLDNIYKTNADGTKLVPYTEADAGKVTVQGELDKLAANISIARNWAGVHWYTDYFESLRLGERVAAGLLQEQMLTYSEPVSMRFKSFDGDWIMIMGTGGTEHGHKSGGYDTDDARILVWPGGKKPSEPGEDWTASGLSDEERDRRVRAAAKRWWNRALIETES